MLNFDIQGLFIPASLAICTAHVANLSAYYFSFTVLLLQDLQALEYLKLVYFFQLQPSLFS